MQRMKSDPTPEAIFGHGFADIIGEYDWDETIRMVEAASAEDVERVLKKAAANKSNCRPTILQS